MVACSDRRISFGLPGLASDRRAGLGDWATSPWRSPLLPAITPLSTGHYCRLRASIRGPARGLGSQIQIPKHKNMAQRPLTSHSIISTSGKVRNSFDLRIRPIQTRQDTSAPFLRPGSYHSGVFSAFETNLGVASFRLAAVHERQQKRIMQRGCQTCEFKPEVICQGSSN